MASSMGREDRQGEARVAAGWWRNGCGGGSRVELITIANWGHLWPLTGSLDATDEILSFFGIS